MNVKTMEKLADEQMEYAKENDYAWYFSMMMVNATYAENPGEAILKNYDDHWEKTKEAIRKDYFHTLSDGVVAKPQPFYMMSLRDSHDLYFGNIICDIDTELQNSERYDDRIKFNQDCLELFDLEDGKENYTLMNTQLAIGEALSDAGRIEESDAYYEKILAEHPGNGYMIANYVLTLKLRGEKDKARELLEKHISVDMEPVAENEMLFVRAMELYRDIGDKALYDRYEYLFKSIKRGKRIEERTVVRTEKKVYPNDPCPCGSGKKYKKCCGRN